MSEPQSTQPKICLTAAGILIHNHKVLLVKHKKLGIWLNPGGHIETDEMPHQAAEREFWEETGVKVRAKHLSQVPTNMTDGSEYLPSPFLTNLHWVSRENYQARMKDGEEYQRQLQWKKGCEKHLNLLYFVEPIDTLELTQNIEESDGLEWFTQAQLADIETIENIRFEVKRAFELLEKNV